MRISCYLPNLLALSLWLAGIAQGESFRTEQGPEDLDGVVVRDVDHENAPAVEVWMEREASASIGEVGPGYYRLSLRGRFRGVPNVRYSMSLNATQRGAAVGGRTFWANAIPADGEFHELVTQLLVRKEGDLEVGLTYRDHAREEDAKLLKEQNLAAMEKPSAENAMAGKTISRPKWRNSPGPSGLRVSSSPKSGLRDSRRLWPSQKSGRRRFITTREKRRTLTSRSPVSAMGRRTGRCWSSF